MATRFSGTFSDKRGFQPFLVSLSESLSESLSVSLSEASATP